MVRRSLSERDSNGCHPVHDKDASFSGMQERVAQERRQPKLADLTPKEEFTARLDHALSTLKLEVITLAVHKTANLPHSCQMSGGWSSRKPSYLPSTLTMP